MVASQVRVSLISGLLVLGFASAAIPSLNHDQSKDNSVNEVPWAPATQPRDFSYNIQDGIQGASQIRQETWKNGTMNGLYAFPIGDGLWQLVNYIADGQGYRVTSSKQVSEAEMLKGAHPEHDTARVDISHDGDKTAYKVSADEIFTSKKNITKAQKERRGIYEVHHNASQAAAESMGPQPKPSKGDWPVGPMTRSAGAAPMPMASKMNVSGDMASGDWPAGPMARSAGAEPIPSKMNFSGDWPAERKGMSADAVPMASNVSGDMASGDWPAGPMIKSAGAAPVASSIENASTGSASGEWPADMASKVSRREAEEEQSVESDSQEFEGGSEVTV